MIPYSIIVTVLLIASVVLAIFQYKKKWPRSNSADYYQNEMNRLDCLVKKQNKEIEALKKKRRELEDQIKNDFDSDTGRAVAADIAGDG